MDPYLGEIRMFAGNYTPQHWMLCNGAYLEIGQFAALFSLMGTTFGGDGRSNFRLPDMRNRTPMHAGSGTGLTPRRLGEYGGHTTVALTVLNIPSHNHAVMANNAQGDKTEPGNMFLAGTKQAGPAPMRQFLYRSPDGSYNFLNPNSVGNTGSGQPHYNQQPFIGINFIICVDGLYPPRP